MSRLFLGNIPRAATEDDVREWVQSQGFLVEGVDLITDRTTGMPRGFGFATLVDKADAEAAVRTLNGKIMGGRPITVNHAVPLNLDGRNTHGRRTA